MPFPSPGDLPDPGIEPVSPALKADSLPTELPGKQKVPLGALESTVGRRFTMLNDEYSTDTNSSERPPEAMEEMLEFKSQCKQKSGRAS